MFTINGSTAPLLFQYRFLIVGNGFLADVNATGKVVCIEEEPGEVWMYGVQPGALAEWGASAPEAHQAFHRAFHQVLMDIASEAPTSEVFEREVQAFMDTVNRPNAALWDRAVVAVRAGETTAEGLDRWPAERPLGVSIAIMREPKPSANVPQETRHAVAA